MNSHGTLCRGPSGSTRGQRHPPDKSLSSGGGGGGECYPRDNRIGFPNTHFAVH